MKTKFTLDHLFLYHYNEMNLMDSLAIEHLIEIDETFREESSKILEMMELLDTEKTKPSTSSIKMILDYDKTSSGEMAY